MSDPIIDPKAEAPEHIKIGIPEQKGNKWSFIVDMMDGAQYSSEQYDDLESAVKARNDMIDLLKEIGYDIGGEDVRKVQ